MKGYRKAIAYITGETIATIALFTGFISAAEWVEITKWLTGIFVSGNVLEWYFGKK